MGPRLILGEIDPEAPYQLLVDEGQVELVWIAGNEIHQTSGRGTSNWGAITPEGQVLGLDVERVGAGYRMEARVLADGIVHVIDGRFSALAGLQVRTVSSSPLRADHEALGVSEHPLRATGAALVWDHSSETEEPWALRPGPTDSYRFVWSTVVNSRERRLLVGVSSWGTIHGKDVSVAPSEPSHFDMVPVLDLFSVPTDASDIRAVASRSEVFLSWSTSRGVHLHRMPLPPAALEMQALRIRDVGAQQVALTNGPVFGQLSTSPVGESYALEYVNATPDCLHPLSASVPAREVYVLPTSEMMRLVRPVSGGWEVDEYPLLPAILGSLHAPLVAPNGWSLQTSSSACRDQAVAYSRPVRARQRRVFAPSGGRWVGASDDAGYLATSEAILRVAWEGASTPSNSFEAEEVATVPVGVDPNTIRVRGDQVSFGIPGENVVVVGTERLHADQGAFALTGDSVLVRRAGHLCDRDRVLAPTDALPLAATARTNGTLVVALQTPRGALLVADIGLDGRFRIASLAACGHGFAQAAAFAGEDLLVIACADEDGPSEVAEPPVSGQGSAQSSVSQRSETQLRPRQQPRIFAGRETVFGHDQVRRAVRRRLHEVRACYEAAENESFPPNLAIAFSVEVDGAVSSVRIREETPDVAGGEPGTQPSTSLSDCLLDVVRSLEFGPTGAGSPVEVVYPMTHDTT